jgi:hypothetical protein
VIEQGFRNFQVTSGSYDLGRGIMANVMDANTVKTLGLFQPRPMALDACVGDRVPLTPDFTRALARPLGDVGKDILRVMPDQGFQNAPDGR